LNELSGREWAQASRSVEEYPDVRSEKQRAHGACFPLSLARQHIEMYTKRGETVLDPFVGIGTTIDACAELGRKGIGVDLNKDFVATAKKDIRVHPSAQDHRLIVGDARRLGRWVQPESVDFVLTSPPYGSLLKNVKGAFAYKWREHSHLDAIDNPTPYSERPEDLGNMEYVPFLDAVGATLAQTFRALKNERYAVWVVKDFRALKEGVPYVNLHSDVIAQAELAGFTLWDIRIYDQTRYRPLVCLGFPSRNFYLNIGHSYLLVFKKR
jgi:DNA modification methylase